ncbi:MAG: hypothetical protein AAGG11_00390 [Pseudomonadota bacterium]
MKWLILGIGLVIVGGGIYTSVCPCERVPGAWLLGEVAAEPVSDWSFINNRDEVPLCQLQVTTWRPHSINLNCMADDGRLYISCANCAGKRWSADALTHPAGRLRAAGTVYPVWLERVTDPGMLDRAWSARLQKIGREPSPRPDHWWSFELRHRQPG